MKESEEGQECSAAAGREAFISSEKHICQWKKKMQCGIESVCECMQTAFSGLHWEGAARWTLQHDIK